MPTIPAEPDIDPQTVPDLYFIRHGQTEWNLQGRFQGISDIPLNDTGRRQSDHIGANLAELVTRAGQAPRALQLFSSPLLRARQTSEIICGKLDVTTDWLTFEPDLGEISYGDWEGMTTLEVKAAFPIARKRRKADRWLFSPPHGESPASRVPALHSFLTARKSPSIIVTHTGVIRICLYLLGFLQRENALVEPISQDKIYVISKGSLARI
ncbi:histidine phosphatase family protein [Hoeflea sp. TYP-13]|uniref:histidine phosphatase family protein n=1 Tax=Hoeflea sp. TYP-13 TaxID=3230023 RepID=UPI0034C6200C